jgi:ribosomal protein S18 acetylase RimI-like enzyme
VPRTDTLTVEPLGRGAVALTQCMAIDADAFPYASVQFGQRAASLRVLVARDERDGLSPPPPRLRGGEDDRPESGRDVETRVVGFLAGQVRRGVLWIHGLAVDRSARRRGVGRALVRAAAARTWAEGLQALVLQVGVANRAAIGLYESEGFSVVERIRGYYPAGVYGSEQDAYRMALRL